MKRLDEYITVCAQQFVDLYRMEDFIDKWGDIRDPDADDMRIIGIYADNHPRLCEAICDKLAEPHMWEHEKQVYADAEKERTDSWGYHGVSWSMFA